MKRFIAALTLGILLGGTPAQADIAGTGVAGVETQVPSVIRSVRPEYPEIARRFRLEGKVLVSVVVDPKGMPAKAEIVNSTNPAFDAAVLSTVRNWRFTAAPGTKELRVVQIPFTFRMK